MVPRKQAEMLLPVSGVRANTPQQTWLRASERLERRANSMRPFLGPSGAVDRSDTVSSDRNKTSTPRTAG